MSYKFLVRPQEGLGRSPCDHVTDLVANSKLSAAMVQLIAQSYCSISVNTRPTDPLGVSTESIVASVGAMSLGAMLPS